MSTRIPDVVSIDDLLECIGAAIERLSLRARSVPIEPRSSGGAQDLEALIHKRERVVTTWSALGLAEERRRPRLKAELERALTELEQSWARIRRRYLADTGP